MNVYRLLLGAGIALSTLSAAEESKPRQESKPDVVLPVMKVRAPRLERFSVMLQTGLDSDRLLIWHVSTRSDGFKMLVGGAQVGDEIISIDGQEVASVPRHRRVSLLHADFKIVVKRATGRRTFELLELEGRQE